MDKKGRSLRKLKVMSMLMQDYSQGEMAKELGVSQPTISRDMRWLDKEAEHLEQAWAKQELKDNFIMITFSMIDGAIVRAFQDYNKIDSSDRQAQREGLRIILRFLGQRCYLLCFLGVQSLFLKEYLDRMEHQFKQLADRIDEFAAQQN